jgi:hypothetical protein
MKKVSRLLTPANDDVDTQFYVFSRESLHHQHVEVQTCNVNTARDKNSPGGIFTYVLLHKVINISNHY